MYNQKVKFTAQYAAFNEIIVNPQTEIEHELVNTLLTIKIIDDNAIEGLFEDICKFLRLCEHINCGKYDYEILAAKTDYDIMCSYGEFYLTQV